MPSDREYLTSSAVAAKWGVSERSVRNYCANGRVPGALLNGKTWNIPSDASKPQRQSRCTGEQSTLLERLRSEQKSGLSGGIYHRVQVELTYNSNHIEGNRLTHDQTRYIFETNTIGFSDSAVNVDDIIETVNHFRSVDMIIREAGRPLTQTMIKRLHRILKTGTNDSRKAWFAVGDYKRIPNEVGGVETASPEAVPEEMRILIHDYESIPVKTYDDILDFHVRFERIHPFQDGNGRVGRLILFKECLRNNIVPFIITDELKMFYYRGLSEWNRERGCLRDTCLTAQDQMKAVLSYFRISFE